MSDSYTDIGFTSAAPSHMHHRFLPVVFTLCGHLVEPGARVLDVGCGNGYTAGQFLQRGCKVVGIDLSGTGIDIARRTYPEGRFELAAADGNILSNLKEDPFDVVISTEVIEHVYAPRAMVRGCFGALRPGGCFVCTTPYHGYLKNLLIALTNKWDRHVNPLWDGGHIKLWSRNTLTRLLAETGFVDLKFRGVGRLPLLRMTMAMAGTRPATGKLAHD